MTVKMIYVKFKLLNKQRMAVFLASNEVLGSVR